MAPPDDPWLPPDPVLPDMPVLPDAPVDPLAPMDPDDPGDPEIPLSPPDPVELPAEPVVAPVLIGFMLVAPVPIPGPPPEPNGFAAPPVPARSDVLPSDELQAESQNSVAIVR
jgi:hypothetical protein